MAAYFAVSGPLIACIATISAGPLPPFDERRIGLDHLAFACSDRDELEAWEIRLSDLGIDNGGIVDADYGSALSCRDPDNIALDFFTPAL